MSATDSEKQIKVPSFCETHRSLLVQQCGYKPNDPWLSLEIATQIAMFQGATTDKKVHEKLDGDIHKIETIGCLACRKPDLFGELVNEVQSAPRAQHIAVIKALGESWIDAAKKQA